MANDELADLKQRIAAARDFAQDESRQRFQQSQNAGTSAEQLGQAHQAVTYRAIGRVLNVLLGVDAQEGDPTPQPPSR